MTSPTMRELADRLLAYESSASKTSEPMESAALRVYEKLQHGLGEFAGVDGFQSLASRALVLAKTEAPSLSAVRVSADGALLGLGQSQTRLNILKWIGLWLAREESFSLPACSACFFSCLANL